jgi:hypothetical protein
MAPTARVPEIASKFSTGGTKLGRYTVTGKYSYTTMHCIPSRWVTETRHKGLRFAIKWVPAMFDQLCAKYALPYFAQSSLL